MKQLPKGPVWDAAKVEKNWCVAAVTTTNSKVPVNAQVGLPADRERVAILNQEAAAKKANGLNRRIDEINARIDRVNAGREEADRFDPVVRFGIGYLPREDSAMVVMDFDKVRDPETGEITADWLGPVLEAPESYTEVSTSGTGLHVLSARAKGDNGTRERNGAGLYGSNARFILLTFNHVPGTPTCINGAVETRRVVSSRVEVKSNEARQGLRMALPEDLYDLTAIPDILAILPNPALGRDEWVRMAHACWAAAAEADPATAISIEQAFYEWSALGRAHGVGRKDGSSPARLWNSIHDVREIGPGTFFYIARELGWSPHRNAVICNPRAEMVALMDAAFDGDSEALQRIARFICNGYRYDTAFVLINAMAQFGGIDAREMLHYETDRAHKIAADTFREVQFGR